MSLATQWENCNLSASNFALHTYKTKQDVLTVLKRQDHHDWRIGHELLWIALAKMFTGAYRVWEQYISANFTHCNDAILLRQICLMKTMTLGFLWLKASLGIIQSLLLQSIQSAVVNAGLSQATGLRDLTHTNYSVIVLCCSPEGPPPVIRSL